MRPLSRPAPVLPVGAVKTYRLARPLRADFWRKATCEEVDCPHWTNGWATTVEANGADEAAIKGSGRRWLMTERLDGGMVRYTFFPHQPCFKAGTHKLPIEREPLHIVRGGDWRANTGLIRTHARGEDWVDDFANHQDKLAERIGRG